ncbi:MAG TPA: CHAD domain-containing protein [Anaerolineaceae bacterium]|nr:CHAD domain-containing protein [Anaerolineaceae bacterium]
MNDTVCIYGARIIHRHLGAMQVEIDGVRESKDIEYVHRLRVASRRMRSALSLFSSCFYKQDYQRISKDIRAVTRALGEARDTDVQVEALLKEEPKFASARLSPGFKRLIMRSQQRRVGLQAEVIVAMDQLQADQVLEKLADLTAPMADKASSVYLFSPGLYVKAYDGIQTQIDELFKHETYIHDPANILELHAMRISAKRLRYSMEAFEDLYQDPIKPFISEVKKLQDALGLVHDLDVWISFVPAFIEEERQRILAYFGHEGPLKRLLPGLNAFTESRKAMREDAYAEFIKLWDAQSEAKLWEKFKRLITTPINLENAMPAVAVDDAPEEPQ